MDWITLLSGKGAPHTGSPDRSAFERDYDRIIFSHPFRRLQDKTQVFPLPEQDFVHTRLTHSLEVSSVGRSLGKKVGEILLQRYPQLEYSQFDFGAIVSAACLTHDLGNPPFGHTGEDAISDFFRSNPQGQFFQQHVSQHQWQDLVNFEGNAQGFRILNSQNQQGLKLTEATLAAFTKYPRPSLLEEVESGRRSQKKFGFFQSEQIIFQELAENLGLRELQPQKAWCRHPLAFLVEAADDICYHIIDLEDGCRLGLVSEAETTELLANILGSKYQADKLKSIEGKDQRIGLLRAVAIGILIEQCAQIFLDHEQEILSGEFDHALADLIDSKDILKEIIAISLQRLYRSTMVLEIEAAGFEVLGGLLEMYSTASYHMIFEQDQFSKRELSVIRLLPDTLQNKLQVTDITIYQLLRHILDFVSGLTDRHAITLYRRLKGMALPGRAN